MDWMLLVGNAFVRFFVLAMFVLALVVLVHELGPVRHSKKVDKAFKFLSLGPRFRDIT